MLQWLVGLFAKAPPPPLCPPKPTPAFTLLRSGGLGGFVMPDDDDQMIIPSHGPYKGQRIQVSADEAKRAVKEGWARDAYAETVEDEKQAAKGEEAEARRGPGRPPNPKS
jgi:hypothetical protein